MVLTDGKPWQYVNLDWYPDPDERSSAFWTRLGLSVSFGWWCWGLGVSMRIRAPYGRARHVSVVLGPLLVSLELWPPPERPCAGCAQCMAEEEVRFVNSTSGLEE